MGNINSNPELNTLDTVARSSSNERIEEVTKAPTIELERPMSEPVKSVPLVGDWQIIAVKSRVDAFNFDALAKEIQDLRAQGYRRIALDLRANRFLNFQAIRFCVEVARKLSEQGGMFALVSCQEKTKRHFEIYGSLEHIYVLRSLEELKEIEAPKSTRGTVS